MADSASSSGNRGLDSLVRLLFMLVLGGAMAFPSVGDGSVRLTAATAAPTKNSSSSVASQPPPKIETEPTTDALKLLADFAGISLSDDAVLSQAQKMATRDAVTRERRDHLPRGS